MGLFLFWYLSVKNRKSLLFVEWTILFKEAFCCTVQCDLLECIIYCQSPETACDACLWLWLWTGPVPGFHLKPQGKKQLFMSLVCRSCVPELTAAGRSDWPCQARVCAVMLSLESCFTSMCTLTKTHIAGNAWPRATFPSSCDVESTFDFC